MMSVVDCAMLAASNSPGVPIVVKATLILTVALIGLRLARRARASSRHAILAGAFGASMALPIASIFAPPVCIGLPVAAQERTAPTPLLVATGVISAAVMPHEGTSAAIPRSSELSVFGMWLGGTALFLVPVIMGLWQFVPFAGPDLRGSAAKQPILSDPRMLAHKSLGK